MKRTTYFIIAMIAGGLILALAVLGYIATTKIDERHRTVSMLGYPQKNSTECFNEVCITETKQGISNRYITRDFEISIERDSLLSQPSITFSSDWEEYIDFNVENNILHINFDLIRLLDNAESVTIKSQPLIIRTPCPIKAIDGDIYNSHINVSGFNCDSVTLAAEARIEISDCRFDCLNITKSHSTYFYNSAVDTIYCNLATACGDWNFDDKSTIGTIIATGQPSYGDFADLQDVNFKEFYWIPTDSTSFTKIGVNFPIKITRQ